MGVGRDFQVPGRSPVLATNGLVATSHPLATAAALEVLRRGGNSMDAAICAVALLSVAEPHMTGPGGDCFVLHAPAGGAPVAYNGSGRAPAAADADLLQLNGLSAIPHRSALAVTVPGAVEAWARLAADHGRLGLDALLAPAIDLARAGCPVAPRVADDWAKEVPVLAGDPVSRELLLPGGRPPGVGETFTNPPLAEALAAIAEQGPDAFYKGWIAEDLLDTLAARGGWHAAEDFAAHRGEYVEPIATEYGGKRILECPPNGQGLTALLALNILKGFDLAGSAPLGAMRLHLQAEALRLAYADRNAFIADPEHAEVPVDDLLGEAYARHRRAAIDPAQAMGELPRLDWPPHRDTVYLCVVDGDGAATSFINSIFDAFGSAITGPRSGITLHSRGAGFVLTPGHPNRLAGGKRPMHTIIPGLVMEGDQPLMPFGVMGGQYQAAGHVHFLTNWLDFGMDVQAALDLPRAFHFAGRHEVERGIPEATVQALRSLGHVVTRAEAPIGGGQAILIDRARGVLWGGSDPRKDGCALGW
ncbi:gamma-glutamyltransferase family protein [Roseospirillum parvum]|uniref:Gamma-glutamyltranspeptidase / glutathione hydrolase n=1 Tax=Roseospirillum parvum TaxID=83401 RepID=A0A1G8CKN6_9PROT|nr:gamma-glutamyltransferase family protein [Roseospirillum parvum]SDH45962.1 gamma-glutamyltranspeptidase / glutathione hydrolase [Roseospirillum parvum]